MANNMPGQVAWESPLQISSPADPDALQATEYGAVLSVIDITMGEFAYSDFYPIHSSAYATCFGVAILAVDGSGVALMHLDPIAMITNLGDMRAFYLNSINTMVTRYLAAQQAKNGTVRFDVVLFKDGYDGVGQFDLATWIQGRCGGNLRNLVNCTDATGPERFSEVIVMPGSAPRIFLKDDPRYWTGWDGQSTWGTPRNVLRKGPSPHASTNIAGSRKCCREIKFDGDTFVSAEGEPGAAAPSSGNSSMSILFNLFGSSNHRHGGGGHTPSGGGGTNTHS